MARRIGVALVLVALAFVPTGASGGDDPQLDWGPARRVSGTIPPTGRKFTYNTTSDLSDEGRFVIFFSNYKDEPGKLFLRRMSSDKLRWVDKPRVEPGPPTDMSDSYRWWDYNVGPTISGSGRFVAFADASSDLAAGDDNRASDVFLYDRKDRSVEMVSVTPEGEPANDHSTGSYITRNGRYVAFTSRATNLTEDGLDHPALRTYVRDLETGETRLASLDTNGEPRGRSQTASVSEDGTRVAFMSSSTHIVPDDTNDATDAFVHDFVTDDTTRVSVDENGDQLVPFEYDESGGSFRDGVDDVVISGNGHVVIFVSHANGLVAGDDNNNVDIFAHDLATGETTRVSEPTGGGDGYPEGAEECGSDGECFGFLRSHSPSVTTDGHLVYFLSGGSELVDEERDTKYGSDEDVYVRDRLTESTYLVNRRYDGTPSRDNNFYPGAISFDGTALTWSSDGKYISGANDTDEGSDVYLMEMPPLGP